MASPLYIAVDLGAGSGRVFLAGVDPGEFLLMEIHRFHYPPVEEDGHLRWDFAHILAEIKTGLRAASVTAKKLGPPGREPWNRQLGSRLRLARRKRNLWSRIRSVIAIDRTQDAMERVFATVPRAEIFEKTGIQFQNFNTLFQLYLRGRSLTSS